MLGTSDFAQQCRMTWQCEACCAGLGRGKHSTHEESIGKLSGDECNDVDAMMAFVNTRRKFGRMPHLHAAIGRAEEERDKQGGKGDGTHELTREKEIEERFVLDRAELCAAEECGGHPHGNDEECQKRRASKETGIGCSKIRRVQGGEKGAIWECNVGRSVVWTGWRGN
jgi:hypothetical protein